MELVDMILFKQYEGGDVDMREGDLLTFNQPHIRD